MIALHIEFAVQEPGVGFGEKIMKFHISYGAMLSDMI